MQISTESLLFKQDDLFYYLSKHYKKKYIEKIINYDIFYDKKSDLTYFRVNLRNKKVIDFKYTDKSFSEWYKSLGVEINNINYFDFLSIFLNDLINVLKHIK